MNHGRDGLGPPDTAAPQQPANGSACANGHGPIRRTVRVVNPNGLHMRIASRFIMAAKACDSVVVLWNGDARADGTSLLDLFGLMVMPGTDVVLEVEGPDAPTACEQLAAILADPGGEDHYGE